MCVSSRVFHLSLQELRHMQRAAPTNYPGYTSSERNIVHSLIERRVRLCEEPGNCCYGGGEGGGKVQEVL